MIWALLVLPGCPRDEVDDWRCIGPLVELMKWRDELEAERVYGGRVMTEAEVAAEEQRHVDEAVAKLRPYTAQCELTWSLQGFQEADNPGLHVKARALRALGAR